MYILTFFKVQKVKILESDFTCTRKKNLCSQCFRFQGNLEKKTNYSSLAFSYLHKGPFYLLIPSGHMLRTFIYSSRFLSIHNFPFSLSLPPLSSFPFLFLCDKGVVTCVSVFHFHSFQDHFISFFRLSTLALLWIPNVTHFFLREMILTSQQRLAKFQSVPKHFWQ